MPTTQKTAAKAAVRPLSPAELATFCTQTAMLLRGGITLQEGMHILWEDSRGTAAEPIYQRILEPLELGSSLYEGLSAAGVFPDYLLQMVAIGEAAGRLEEVMDALAAYYERSAALRRSIRSAITYPAVMLGVMGLVVYILAAQVLPIFRQVFQQLGSDLSPLALGMLGLGAAVSRYGVLLLAGGVCLGLGGFFFYRTPQGRRFFRSLVRLFPPTRRLSEQIAATRFASALAMMMASGLDTTEALRMSQALVDDPATRRRIEQCLGQVEAGAPFAQSLLDSGLFTGLAARMVSVGFKTGRVDEVMEKLAARYEEETAEAIAQLLAVLEPTLVAILSISAGMILLSAILPLMGVLSAMG